MSNFDIYGIGAALVDTEIDVTNADLENFGIEKGIMTLVDEPRQIELLGLLKDHLCQSKRASGGSAANSIIAAQYFGASTFFSCKVADDDNGRFYLQDLSSAGVNYCDTTKYEGITGKCLVMITDDAERTMNTFLGISETLSTDDIDEAALQKSKYVYIEGYLVTSESGKPAAIRLREMAEKHGVKTAFSLSDPFIAEHFREGVIEIIGGGVDLLFCNEDEAMSFTRTDSLEKAAESLKTSAKTFVITQGAKGALVFDGNTMLSVSAPSVTAVDTNGAGDMFAGAFLYAITQGQSYADASKLGVKAAAQVVSQYGPRLGSEQHLALLQTR